MFRARNRQASPLRQLVYVSDLKLQGLVEQIPPPARRDIAAELKLDLKLVSLTLKSSATSEPSAQDSRFARLALVEEHMRRSGQLGGPGSKHGYVAIEADMDWVPLDDDQTILFCGYNGTVLLALGGSVSHLLGHPPSTTHLGSQPYTIRAAIHGTGTPRPADLGRDLLAAARAVCVTPQPVKFLASVIARGPIPRDPHTTEYLLATPLYVQVVDSVSPSDQ